MSHPGASFLSGALSLPVSPKEPSLVDPNLGARYPVVWLKAWGKDNSPDANHCA